MAPGTSWRVLVCLLAGGLLLASCGAARSFPETPGVSRVPVPRDDYLKSPAWSPDGSRLAATIQTGGGEMIPASKIVVVDLATGEAEVLLEADNAYRWVQAWSPDGAYIAFAAVPGMGKDSLQQGIWVMRADGSGELRFLSEGGLAAWSPDGRQMAIHRIGRDQSGSSIKSIRLLDLESGEERTILSWPAGGTFSWRLSWSPDGTRLAFALSPATGHDGSDRDIYVLDLQTDSLTRLTQGGHNGFPTWSPDGRLLAYVKEVQVQGGFSYLIVIARADGSCKVTALGPADYLADLAWSPDGTRIAFGSWGGLYLLDIAAVLGQDFLTTGPVCP